VIHYARFEMPFLSHWHSTFGADRPFPFDVVCCQRIAKRLIPGLPSSTIRALSGHFGHVMGEAHRASEHVRATWRIWRALVARLDLELGIRSWEDLKSWLAREERPRPAKRVFLLPRVKRLGLPDCPGVYRMIGADGSLLYVGKASSLRDRVNSYFRTRAIGRARMPEMLAQVHDIDVTTVETSLEAALLEADEIKRWCPPYNASLRDRGQTIRFRSSDFSRTQAAPDPQFPNGPFTTDAILDLCAAIDDTLRTGRDPQRILPWAEAESLCPENTLRAGIAAFAENHPFAARQGIPGLLQLGARLPVPPDIETEDLGEAVAAADPAPRVWEPADVVAAIEGSLRYAARITARARWLTRLCECSLSWCLPGEKRRWLAIQAGQIESRATVAGFPPTPAPAGWRLCVLLSEIRRLVASGNAVELVTSPWSRFTATDLERRLNPR
jgi:DNA polymerase-3 subunit epsilon